MDLDRQTILLIEDDPDIVEVIRVTLDQDHNLLVASSSLDVLGIARDRSPDLILLERKLPGVDSLEICSRLGQDPITHNIPVIFIVDPREVPESDDFESAAADYILKPVQAALVKVRVRSHLELKFYRDLLEDKTTIDTLTGIPNRRPLDELLNREWRRAIRYQTPQSLILMDIDFFGEFNRCSGHPAGDACLRRIAQILVINAKRETDYAARFNGDEFACLLPETDAGGAMRVAQKIQDMIEELNIAHPCSPVADHITMSFGVATMKPTARMEPAQLIYQADLLLKEAQRSGHNQIKCIQ